jgi:hypothetical protein
MCGEFTNSSRVDEFVEAVKLEILARHFDCQEDYTYKNIYEFNKVLYGYNDTLSALRPSNVLTYQIYISYLKSPTHTLIEKTKEDLRERGMQSNRNAEEEITQMTIIEELLDMYSQINTLFGEICIGKTLLLF